MPSKSKAIDITVPFSEQGDLLHYDKGYWTGGLGVVRRPNLPFTATLHLTGTRRGRSAAYFVWADDDGAEYPMFITDVAALLQSATAKLDAGRITASWIVQKRGENYGIRLATLGELAVATTRMQAAGAEAGQ